MIGAMIIFGMFVYIRTMTPRFSTRDIEIIQATWKDDAVVRALTTGEGNIPELLLEPDRLHSYLSPDYVKHLCHVVDYGPLCEALIDAQEKLDDEERARCLAAAFLKVPGETLQAGIATVVRARRYAEELSVKDRLRSTIVYNFSVAYELMVAGCIRAIENETAFDQVMRLPTVIRSIKRSIKYQHFDILGVPQILTNLDYRFGGYRDINDMEDCKRSWRRVKRRLWHLVLILMLPILALYPPLASEGYFKIPASLRYGLHESLAVVYFFLIATSDLNLYRDDPYWLRDWGLLVWTFMLLFTQCFHCKISTLQTYISDKTNLVDIIANAGCLLSFLLNLCHGEEQIFSTVFSDWCDTWPQEVPLAAWEILSVSVLVHGLRGTRLLMLQPTLGPLLLSVLSMSVDMINWIVIVLFPLLGFAGALRVLYSDKYLDPAKPYECDINPDVDFESFTFSIQILIEMMLGGEGYYACFRDSSQTVLGTIYSISFVLVSTITLVNMLIALMAKTFDGITEDMAKQFLFTQTRIISEWLAYPPIPPPFNALSLPFYTVKLSWDICIELYLLCFVNEFDEDHEPPPARLEPSNKTPQFTIVRPEGRARSVSHGSPVKVKGIRPRIKRFSSRVRDAILRLNGNSMKKTQFYEPNEEDWARSFGPDPLESLTQSIVQFKRNHATREIKRSDFIKSMFEHMGSLQAQVQKQEELASQALSQLQELQDEIRLLREETHNERRAQIMSLSMLE